MAVVTPPTLTDIPPFPALSDRALGTYNSKAYAFGTHMGDVFNGEMEALAANVFNNATDAKNSALAAAGSVIAAAASAAAAAASAAGALGGPTTIATSSSAMTISTGSKSMVLDQTGKSFTVGQRIVSADPTSPATRYMLSRITAFNSGTGAVTHFVDAAVGSGTYSSWSIGLAGEGTVLPTPTGGDVGKLVGVVAGGAYALVAGRGSGGSAASTGNLTLTSASPSAQAITPTRPGQWVMLPVATTYTDPGTGLFTLANKGGFDLELRDSTATAIGFIRPATTAAVGLADNTTAAGVWTHTNTMMISSIVGGELAFASAVGTGSLHTVVALDAQRELLIFTGATRTVAVVWDAAAAQFGAPVIVRATGMGRIWAIKSATDQVLMLSVATTDLEGVTLTVTGTSITPNTAAPVTLANAIVGTQNFGELIAVVGQGYALCYCRTGVNGLRAITVTGTTVAIGAESALTGTVQAAQPPIIYDYGGGKILAFSVTSTTMYASPYTQTGTTLALGTNATITLATGALFYTRMLASGRVGVISANAALLGIIASITGTVAAISSAALSATSSGVTITAVHRVGSQLILAMNSNGSPRSYNVLTDNAGTAVAGTEVVRDNSGSTGGITVYCGSDATSLWTATIQGQTQASGEYCRVGISGNNAAILYAQPMESVTYDTGGWPTPTSTQPNVISKQPAGMGVLVGGAVSFAAIQDRALMWQCSAGSLSLAPRLAGFSLLNTNYSNFSTRSAAADWQWAARLNSTGTVATVQKLKVIA